MKKLLIGLLASGSILAFADMHRPVSQEVGNLKVLGSLLDTLENTKLRSKEAFQLTYLLQDLSGTTDERATVQEMNCFMTAGDKGKPLTCHLSISGENGNKADASFKVDKWQDGAFEVSYNSINVKVD